MDKQELKHRIKQLVKENKTEEALKLLSQAQLSELDKVVLSLSNRYKRAKEDWMLDNISKEDSDRALNKINNVLLELSDKVESNFRETKSEVEQITLLPQLNENSKKTKPFYAKINEKGGISKYLAFFLIPLIIVSVVIYRSQPPSKKINSSEIKSREVTYTWDNFEPLYFENFANPKNSSFRSDIWNTKNQKDYSAGLEKDRWYVFNIKKRNFARHKYLGNISYDSSLEPTPFSINVIISNNSKCNSSNNCLGRGLTVKYSKNNNSAYSFTLNDDGRLQFIKHSNIFKSNERKSLYTTNVSIKKNYSHQLGVICFKNQFHLFFDKKFLITIENNELNGKFNGVYANGNGTHIFDEVVIYKQI